MERFVAVRLVVARRGWLRQAGLGAFRLGKVGQGMARLGRHGLLRSGALWQCWSGCGMVRQAGHGTVSPGAAWRVKVRFGKAGRAWQGALRYGRSGHG